MEISTRHSEYMIAQLTSYVINFSQLHPKDAITPQMLMPSEYDSPNSTPVATPEEITASLDRYFMGYTKHTPGVREVIG